MTKDGKNKNIYITDFDLSRLRGLIETAKVSMARDARHLTELEAELQRARVVNSKDIPDDVITMNSEVHLTDVDTGEDMILTLAFPSDADMENKRISILAPIGTAIIGYRKGDIIEWQVPSGKRRLKVVKILYQPESAGDYDL